MQLVYDEITSSKESHGFQIQQRVHIVGDSRRIGTVKYVGPVVGYSGKWIGVDWDNGEGKHDGSVNGVRYFSVRGERSGSFVRPQNLSPGISFIEALFLRYRGDYTKEEEDEMYVLSARNKRVTIELVGKNKAQEKLSRFDELHGASVSYLGVSSTGPQHEINSIIPNLRLLDLTGNLLSKWQDVAAICEELPCLEVLNLTNNFIMQDMTELPLLKTIQILVLNSCGITWEQVEMLKQSLPAIDELHLMTNNLRILTDIRLSENPIADPGRGGAPRYVLIARLLKVQILNGSEVSARERKESEIRYLHLVMAKMQADDVEIKQLHPRFEELKLLHGIEDERRNTSVSGAKKMGSGLISITLKCVGPSIGEKPPLTKKLPATTTVGKLKALCESFFKLNSIKPKLFLQEEGSPLPLLLEDEMESIMELGIGSGSTILVDEEA